MKLTYDSALFKHIEQCIDNGRKFVIIGVGIFSKTGAHANMLIIDNVNNTVELFEPHGKFEASDKYATNQFYNSLKYYFLKDLKQTTGINYKFIAPLDFCPKLNLQALQSREEIKDLKDPRGFLFLEHILC